MSFPNPGYQPQQPQPGYAPQQGYQQPPQQYAPQQPQYQPQYQPQPQYQAPVQQPVTQSVDEFFANAGGGGAPSFKFNQIGDRILGTILAMQARQKTDAQTKAPKFNKDGVTPQIQLEVTLQTQLTGWAGVDPTKIPVDPQTNQPAQDDGKRRIFLFFHMRDAFMEALAAAGVQKPEIGDQVAVEFIGTEPNPTGVGNPSKLYKAWFKKGAGPQADAFFQGQQQQEAAPQVAYQPQAPAPQQYAPQPQAPAPMQQPQYQQPMQSAQQPPAPGQYPVDPPF